MIDAATLQREGHRLLETEASRFERYLAEIFTALGMDVDTAGTRATPRRFLQAMIDATAG